MDLDKDKDEERGRDISCWEFENEWLRLHTIFRGRRMFIKDSHERGPNDYDSSRYNKLEPKQGTSLRGLPEEPEVCKQRKEKVKSVGVLHRLQMNRSKMQCPSLSDFLLTLGNLVPMKKKKAKSTKPPSVNELKSQSQAATKKTKNKSKKNKMNELQCQPCAKKKKIKTNVLKADTKKRNVYLDKALKNNILNKKLKSYQHNFLLSARKKLPVYLLKDQLLETIQGNQVVVIIGDTGCGKTTQIPQIVLDEFIMRGEGSTCRIVCALTCQFHVKPAAEQVAKERDEPLGDLSVSYKLGSDRIKTPNGGSITYCTIGCLLKSMTDRNIFGISHVILDGVHERDMLTDVVITLLKDLLLKHIHLKVILMSATLNASDFSHYFDSCPILHIPECRFRRYPIEDLYLEDVIETLSLKFYPPSHNCLPNKDCEKYKKTIEPYLRSLKEKQQYSQQTLESLRNPDSEKIDIDLIAKVVLHICQKEQYGGIIVFLPTPYLILQLHITLESNNFFKQSGFVIIEVHSQIPPHLQEAAFETKPLGVRKIILASNIAETSITIDDVVHVVDSGRMVVKKLNVKTKEEYPMIDWISSANALQRRGRVGRVQFGKCYKLYSRARERTFLSFPVPEMLSSSTSLKDIVPFIKEIKGAKNNGVPSFFKRLMNPPESIPHV